MQFRREEEQQDLFMGQFEFDVDHEKNTKRLVDQIDEELRGTIAYGNDFNRFRGAVCRMLMENVGYDGSLNQPFDPELHEELVLGGVEGIIESFLRGVNDGLAQMRQDKQNTVREKDYEVHEVLTRLLTRDL